MSGNAPTLSYIASIDSRCIRSYTGAGDCLFLLNATGTILEGNTPIMYEYRITKNGATPSDNDIRDFIFAEAVTQYNNTENIWVVPVPAVNNVDLDPDSYVQIRPYNKNMVTTPWSTYLSIYYPAYAPQFDDSQDMSGAYYIPVDNGTKAKLVVRIKNDYPDYYQKLQYSIAYFYTINCDDTRWVVTKPIVPNYLIVDGEEIKETLVVTTIIEQTVAVLNSTTLYISAIAAFPFVDQGHHGPICSLGKNDLPLTSEPEVFYTVSETSPTISGQELHPTAPVLTLYYDVYNQNTNPDNVPIDGCECNSEQKILLTWTPFGPVGKDAYNLLRYKIYYAYNPSGTSPIDNLTLLDASLNEHTLSYTYNIPKDEQKVGYMLSFQVVAIYLDPGTTTPEQQSPSNIASEDIFLQSQAPNISVVYLVDSINVEGEDVPYFSLNITAPDNTGSGSTDGAMYIWEVYHIDKTQLPYTIIDASGTFPYVDGGSLDNNVISYIPYLDPTINYIARASLSTYNENNGKLATGIYSSADMQKSGVIKIKDVILEGSTLVFDVTSSYPICAKQPITTINGADINIQYWWNFRDHEATDYNVEQEWDSDLSVYVYHVTFNNLDNGSTQILISVSNQGESTSYVYNVNK